MASSPAGWDDRWGRLKEGFVGGKSGVGAAPWCVGQTGLHRARVSKGWSLIVL